MSKSKKKSSKDAPFLELNIYGIWDKKTKTIIFVALKEEDVELEYDMEGYSEDSHLIVSMMTYYDFSSLES